MVVQALTLAQIATSLGVTVPAAVEYFRGKPGFVEIKAEGGTIEDNANKIIKAIEDGN